MTKTITSVFDEHLQAVLFKKMIDSAKTEQELISICESYLKEKKPELFAKKLNIVEPYPFLNTEPPITRTDVNLNNTKTYYATQSVDLHILNDHRNKSVIMADIRSKLANDLMEALLGDNVIEFLSEEDFALRSHRFIAKINVVMRK
jgi:hypothetical protein